MTELNDPHQPMATHHGEHPEDRAHRHGSHHLMMMLMCAPMLVIVVLLITSGTASAATLLFPLACIAMMAAMMAFMMPKDR